MILFELVVGLLLAGSLFVLWSDRVGAPYPALLALVGAVIALLPGTPEVSLDPELALTLFVAPILLDAAYEASPRDLRKNIASVTSLAFFLVVVTVAAVAAAARLVVPDMGWAAAIALGAIVAPSDASAANSVLRKLRPPHRLLVILEGESMFNDVTSLIIYRVAVGAAMTGAFSGWSLVPILLLSCGGGIFAGWLLARVAIWVLDRVGDIAVNVVLQFVCAFAVWMIADRLGLSAVLTMVTFAMALARRMEGRMDARRRIASHVVWKVAVLVLNVLAYLLIGLQLERVLSRHHGQDLRTYALCAGVVFAVVVLVRIAWVMAYTAALRWKVRRFRSRGPSVQPVYGSGILASWCGMRGTITLAAALALPVGPTPFPHRDIIVLSAFCVVLGSLVIQGLTVWPLMQWLGLKDDGSVEREIGISRAETARAALRALAAQGADSPAAEILRNEYRARILAEERGTRGAWTDEAGVAALQRKAVLAQREALRDLRARKVIGEDAFHVVEKEIDLLELTAEARVGPASGPAES